MQELLQFIQTTGFMSVELGNIIIINALLLFGYLGIR